MASLRTTASRAVRLAASTSLRAARPAPSALQPRQWLAQPACVGLRHAPPTAVRWNSQSAGDVGNKHYDFAQIRELSASPSPERILIDVREPAEYASGYIPTAINLPVKTQPDALFLSADEFEERMGFAKPDPGAELVFYCRSGVRSAAAAQLARQSGYTNVSEYQGSWLDWEKNGGAAAKP